MAGKPFNLLNFWNELKRRKVIRAALIYIAIAWAIIDATDTIFPRLGLPEWTVTFVLLLLIIIFILVIVLTWVFDITPEGIKVTEDIESAEGKKKRRKGTPKTSSRQVKPADKEESSDNQVVLTMGKQTSFPSNLRKIILPVIVILIVISIIIGKQKLSDMLGIMDQNRENAILHVNSAREYIEKGNLDIAMTELEKAFQSDPDYSYAWSSLAAINVKQGDLDKAVMNTIKALECDPENSQAAYNMAIALDDKKDYNQAEHWYKEAIKIDSAFKKESVYIPASSALGRLYNNAGLPTMAIIVLNRARKQYPDSKYIYLLNKNLGNAYLLQGQADSAVKYLELSYSVAPAEPETSLFLARAYESAGMLTRSIGQWQRYIELETDTAKISVAKKHLKEIAVRQLQEIIK